MWLEEMKITKSTSVDRRKMILLTTLIVSPFLLLISAVGVYWALGILHIPISSLGDTAIIAGPVMWAFGLSIMLISVIVFTGSLFASVSSIRKFKKHIEPFKPITESTVIAPQASRVLPTKTE